MRERSAAGPGAGGIDRRGFVALGLGVAGGLALARTGGLDRWVGVAAAQTGPVAGAGPAGRYGPLRPTPDANGLLLPDGFRSRLVATAGERVAATDYVWHPFPDGAATIATDSGGWIYVSNSEVPYPGKGGAGAIRFDRDGRIIDAYRVLEGTTFNCSGGMTPWGTWLSGEEIERGLVYECDPFGRAPGEPRPAMGRFFHEMSAADPVREVVYLTEDQFDGLFYRFRPVRWGDLNEGVLEAAAVDAAGTVTWVPVRDPAGSAGPTRHSAPGATPFPGMEGVAIDAAGNNLYLTTKLDDHVYRLDLTASKLTPIYQGGGILSGVDNLTVHEPTGDLFVCEDGGDMQVVVIAPDGSLAPFAQVLGQPDSEITGIAFDPAGKRLYFNSQRAPTEKKLGDLYEGLVDARGMGQTFEVTGPFAGVTPVTTSTTTPRTTTTRKPRRRKRRSS